MSAASTVSAAEAIERLRAGNERYVATRRNDGDISAELVKKLSEEGQAPYACVISCADSRVVPEHIFSCGLGEVFCIRVAGNVVGAMELASSVYAAEHLGVKLIVMLGHTQCGAVASAIEARESAAAAHANALTPLVANIVEAIGAEQDPRKASELNVATGISRLKADGDIAHLVEESGLEIVGAIYNTDTGAVDFL